MDIWEIVEWRYDGEEEIEDGEVQIESCNPPVTLEILINAMTNTKLYKKFKPSLPTPQQALKDLNRILNAQKVRSWFLRTRS